MQSKLESFIEASTNILIGIGVSFIANIIVLPAFGYDVTTEDAFYICLVFTAIGLVRTYLVRRMFNWIGLRRDK